MIRRRLAAFALTAGLGLFSCGCLNLGHNGNASTCNGTGTSSSGGLFSFLHRHNNTTTTAGIECCPNMDCPTAGCPTCGVESYDGPALQSAPASQVIPVMPGATLPSTAPPPRLVPTPTTSMQTPWAP